MLANTIDKSIRCDCIGGEHYLHFFGFLDEKDQPYNRQLYIDLCAHTRGQPLWSRIKEAWKIIREKEDACYDGIILEKAKSQEVIAFLHDFWKDTK